MDWVDIWAVVLAGIILFTALTGEGEESLNRALASFLFLPVFGRVWGWW